MALGLRLFIGVVTLVASTRVQAIVVTFLSDQSGDAVDIRKAVANSPLATGLKGDAEAFGRDLSRMRLRHFLQLFGHPAQELPGRYAKLCTEPEFVGLSGMRYSDPEKNKDHRDFYLLSDFGALEVFFQIDGETPAWVSILSRVDDRFVSLKSDDDAAARIAWDRERLDKMIGFTRQLRPAVFPFVIDLAAESLMNSGEFSTNKEEKLAAWIELGKRLGYRLEQPQKGRRGRWEWRRDDGTVARQVDVVENGSTDFIWYDTDGHHEVRSERGWYVHSMDDWRWCGQADKPGKWRNIRFERASSADAHMRPHAWTWYGVDGKEIRSEWDDDDDGIPDWVGPHLPRESGVPLALRDSWAIHPELIPETSRIPDQPDRRVPIIKTSKL